MKLRISHSQKRATFGSKFLRFVPYKKDKYGNVEKPVVDGVRVYFCTPCSLNTSGRCAVGNGRASAACCSASYRRDNWYGYWKEE